MLPILDQIKEHSELIVAVAGAAAIVFAPAVFLIKRKLISGKRIEVSIRGKLDFHLGRSDVAIEAVNHTETPLRITQCGFTRRERINFTREFTLQPLMVSSGANIPAVVPPKDSIYFIFNADQVYMSDVDRAFVKSSTGEKYYSKGNAAKQIAKIAREWAAWVKRQNG